MSPSVCHVIHIIISKCHSALPPPCTVDAKGFITDPQWNPNQCIYIHVELGNVLIRNSQPINFVFLIMKAIKDNVLLIVSDVQNIVNIFQSV